MSHAAAQGQAHLFDLDGCLFNETFRKQYTLLLAAALEAREGLLLQYMTKALTADELARSSEPDAALVRKVVEHTQAFQREFYADFRKAVQHLLLQTNRALFDQIQVAPKDMPLWVGCASNRQDRKVDQENILKSALTNHSTMLPSMTEAMLDVTAILGANMQPLLSDFLYPAEQPIGQVFADIQALNEHRISDITKQEEIWSMLKQATPPLAPVPTLQEIARRIHQEPIAELDEKVIAINDDGSKYIRYIFDVSVAKASAPTAPVSLLFPISDMSKVAIYLQQIQYTMLTYIQSGHKPPLHISLYDDLPGLLQDGSELFKKFPELIPAGVTVHFVQHTGDKTKNLDELEVSGTGPIFTEQQLRACIHEYNRRNDAINIHGPHGALLHAVAHSNAIPGFEKHKLPERPSPTPLLLGFVSKAPGSGSSMLEKRKKKAAEEAARQAAAQGITPTQTTGPINPPIAPKGSVGVDLTVATQNTAHKPTPK